MDLRDGCDGGSALARAGNDSVVIRLYSGAMSDAVATRRPELSEFHAALLDFEKEWWSLPGSKEAEIRQRFDISTTRYYQLLNALIDTEGALAHDPLLVKRLRRLRESRQRERTARRLGVTIRV
jgi:hypothetical protein